MKKLDFYTRLKKEGKEVAVLVSGYTDGKFNYYKNGSWFAILPTLGLTFCQPKSTRKELVNSIYNTEIIDKINNFINTRLEPDAVEYFEKLIEKSEEKQC